LIDSQNREVKDLERLLQVAEQYLLEWAAVYGFVALTDQTGFPAFGGIEHFAKRSREIATDYKILFKARPEPVFGLAQHHGVPTRLLDWTRNPLTAAYFAATPFEKASNTGRLAIWGFCEPLVRALDHQWFFDSMTCERSSHHFLHVQDGLFYWATKAPFVAMHEGVWPPFEQMIQRQRDPKETGSWKPLRKLTLPQAESGTLLRLLWRSGYHRAKLRPTYDNVAGALFELWEQRPFDAS
jgi:hypothetical protein